MLEPETAGTGILIIILNVYSGLPYDIKQRSSIRSGRLMSRSRYNLNFLAIGIVLVFISSY